MSINEDVVDAVKEIISGPWSPRDGQVVPESSDVTLLGGAVKLDATILYSDLADSTELVLNHTPQVASEVMKCFLGAASRIIRHEGGEIRSFDGDRVMGIYIGDYKNTRAARTALKINWAVLNVVKPKLESAYGVLLNGKYKLRHATGVDTSMVHAVRGGMRNNNDLVWVGRAPNIAAKLSNLREEKFYSYVTPAVFNMMSDEAKFATQLKTPMWEYRLWPAQQDIGGLYRSEWTWAL